MIRKRIIISLSIIIGISVGAFFLIKIAQGYRPDFSSKRLRPNGLLIAVSTPNQAAIFLDGKQVKSKTTPANINLPPGEYEVEIKKDGYSSWKKKLLIKKELVAKTNAYLFATYSDLKALTSTGASKPIISPDAKKVAYAVSGQENDKNGLWVLSLSDRPLGLNPEPIQILKSAPKGRQFEKGTYQWSPDSKQILITLEKLTPQGKITEESFLVNSNQLNPATKLVDINNQILGIKRRWQNEEEIVKEAKLDKLPEELLEILNTSTVNIEFSPDETKILYEATASASIPEELIPPFPGASSQAQSRDIKSGKVYVYDIKEDRNFYVLDAPQESEDEKQSFFPKISWFPTSKNLFIVQEDKISIIEYEGTNLTDVYSGPFENSFAFPFPSASKILVLTSLSKETPINLYSISLR